jgi:quercetin dioxygenase-like cupin family protein
MREDGTELLRQPRAVYATLMRPWHRAKSAKLGSSATFAAQLADLKLQIDGLVPPDKLFRRRVLFDGLYASFPKDPEAKVQIYTAEIAPKGWTNFHCHNGATFFIALQGIFEAHFEEGILIHAKAGDVYSEPISKMHRGHNPHDTIPYLCVAFCVTAPDRDHVTNVVQTF